MLKTRKRNLCSLAVRSALVSTVAVTAGQALPALAQGEQLMLEEVIVTARKRTESLQDVPLSINAFNRAMLDEAGINSLTDIAEFTPGFDFAQAFGRQDFRPAIRGQSTIQGGPNAGLFIDGFFVGEGGATLPLTAVERVEVVKGPQGALYGRSTLAGAVNYVLKQPTETFEGEARVTAGEDGELRGDLTARGPLSDNMGYMVSLSYYTYDGQYENDFAGNAIGGLPNNDDIGGEETTSFASVLTWNPSDSFDAALNVMWEDTSDDPYAIGLLDSSNNNCAFGPAPNPPAGTPGDGITGAAYNDSGYFCGEVDIDDILDPNNGKTSLENSFYQNMGTEFEALRLGLTLGWDLEGHRLQSKTSFHDYEASARQDQTFGGGDFYVVSVPFPPFAISQRFGFLTETEEESDEWSQELTLSSTSTGPLSYLVGAYYYERDRSSQERNSSEAGLVATAPGYDVFPLIDQADKSVSNWAVYGQLIYDFSDDLTAGVELRYSEDEVEATGGSANLNLSEKYDAILPRFTVNWSVTDDMMLYGVVSKGNKPGDFNTSSNIRDNQRAVDEEEAWNYEMGVKSTIMDGRATLNGAVYYIDWEKQQLTTTTAGADGSGSFSILDNLGETEIWGAEIEFNASLTQWWDLYVGYAYTDSEIKDYRISAVDSVTPNGMLSGYEEAAQFGFPYAANGDVVISGTELPQVSKHQATISNTFSGNVTDNWDWFARVDYLYNSERYAQVYNAADTGDSSRVNLRAGLRNPTFDIEVWVRNATDDDTSPALIRYVQTQSGFFTFGPDRAIGATLPEQRAAGITLGMRF